MSEGIVKVHGTSARHGKYLLNSKLCYKLCYIIRYLDSHICSPILRIFTGDVRAWGNHPLKILFFCYSFMDDFYHI